MNDRPAFHAGESRWVPCDGRGIADSKLAKLWGKDNAPDLRGVFLRGLNRFDPQEREWTGVVPGGQRDLEAGRQAGGKAQGDTVGGHRHDLPDDVRRLGDHDSENPDFYLPRKYPASGRKIERFTGYYNRGGETRPRNVAVYYYIKIN